MLLLKRHQAHYVDAVTPPWVAAVVLAGGSVSAAQQARVKALGKSLKGSGIWSKLDRLWLHAAEDEFQATIDIVANATASKVGTPTFTASQGYTGNAGGTSFIDSGFNPTTAGGKHSQASSSFGVYTRTNIAAAGSNASIGAFDGTYVTRLYPRFTDGNCYWTVNGVGNATAALLPTQGMYAVSADSAQADFYKNGAHIQTAVGGAAGLANVDFWIGYTSDDQHAISFIGGFLTAAEIAQLTVACNAYMTSLGTNVF